VLLLAHGNGIARGLSSQCGLNVAADFLGLVHGGIAFDDAAVASYQKLGEIPLDGFAAQ
jgi:hypothetical protein